MSTLSNYFQLVLATPPDIVDVTAHVANNFSSLDAILSIAHTGSGQLKSSLTLATPTLINPTFSGTLAGANLIAASTGRFNTITATGGILTVSTLNIGTYALPSTIGATNQLMTVITGNATWVTPAGGTGANTGLSNLASVAINTNLNTFSAGFVTVSRVIATSGALTGLTVFQASTGTFAGNVTVTGTLTADVVNCTGGTITAGSITLGTYALPAAIGTTGQILTVAAGPTLNFQAGPGNKFQAYNNFSGTSTATVLALTRGDFYEGFISVRLNNDTQFSMQINATTSANYHVRAHGWLNGAAATGTGDQFLSATSTSANSIIFASVSRDIVAQFWCGPSTLDSTSIRIQIQAVSTSAPIIIGAMFDNVGATYSLGFVSANNSTMNGKIVINKVQTV